MAITNTILSTAIILSLSYVNLQGAVHSLQSTANSRFVTSASKSSAMPVECKKKKGGKKKGGKKGGDKDKEPAHRKVSAVDVAGSTITVVNQYGKDPTTYKVVETDGSIGQDFSEFYLNGGPASLAQIKPGMFVTDVKPMFDVSKLRKMVLATTMKKIYTSGTRTPSGLPPVSTGAVPTSSGSQP